MRGWRWGGTAVWSEETGSKLGAGLPLALFARTAFHALRSCRWHPGAAGAASNPRKTSVPPREAAILVFSGQGKAGRQQTAGSHTHPKGGTSAPAQQLTSSHCAPPAHPQHCGVPLLPGQPRQPLHALAEHRQVPGVLSLQLPAQRLVCILLRFALRGHLLRPGRGSAASARS